MRHIETSDLGDKNKEAAASIAPSLTTPTEQSKLAPAPMPAGFASHEQLLGPLASDGCTISSEKAHPIAGAIHRFANDWMEEGEHAIEKAGSFVYHHPWESAAIGVAAIGAGIAAPEVAAWVGVGAFSSFVATMGQVDVSVFSSIPLECDPNATH